VVKPDVPELSPSPAQETPVSVSICVIFGRVTLLRRKT
jgi:hypothetical protein